jgi:TetR/AcrR family transcriptional regulator, regulator of autoinduction and epiphytic fitness
LYITGIKIVTGQYQTERIGIVLNQKVNTMDMRVTLKSAAKKAPVQGAPRKLSFKEQQLLAREDAILDSVNTLLATKGYDLMTMDEVAADVGIAKPSLYKHFDSKEELAAAAMVRLLQRTLAHLQAQDPKAAAGERIKDLLRWALAQHLEGTLPMLPSTRSSIRTALMAHKGYMNTLMEVSDAIGALITKAQKEGAIAKDLPPEAVLYTIFARACDPVLDFLKLGGLYKDAEIIEILIRTSFAGLSGAAPKAAKK